MHSKRSLIRVLARILYACGFVLLVAGIVLSAAASTYASSPGSGSMVEANAFNAVEVPFTGIQNSLPIQEPTIDPACNCIRTPTAPVATQPSGSPSSLVFTDGCDCTCESVTATICNVGGDMKEEVNIQLYYSPNGNPTSGEVVKRGPIAPLASGKCLALNYTPTRAGNYAFHVRQESGANGPRDVWSSACMVDGSCYAPPTPTETPFQPATATFTPTAPVVEITLTDTPTSVATTPAVTPATPTSVVTTPAVTPATPTSVATTPVTNPPTSTATQPPQARPFNLSFICGYAGDDYLLWWVKNNTNQDAEFTWRVSGSDERGTGTVEANGVAYFTTSAGDKTVGLFFNDELIDTEPSAGPCKENMLLSVVCTEEGQRFVARNPNNFNVDYSWTIDGQPGGRGMLPANGTVNLVTVPQGTHTVELTWTDTRPGTHTVRLTSSPEDCVNTATPTQSPTAPLVEITLTPTRTNTQPVVTATPSPTATQTQPGVTPPTPTRTNTAPVTIVTATPSFTPTRTNTPPFIVVTTTPTNTQPVTVITTTPVPPTPTFITPATPTQSQTPQIIVVTPVPTQTPQIIVVTPVPTQTPQIIVVTPVPTQTPQTIVVTPVPTQTPQIQVVTPVPSQTPQIIVVTQIPVTGPTSTATQLVTLAPPVIVITTTPALIPETGADLVGPAGLVSLGSLGGLFTNLGLFMLGTALALTGIRSLLSR